MKPKRKSVSAITRLDLVVAGITILFFLLGLVDWYFEAPRPRPSGEKALRSEGLQVHKESPEPPRQGADGGKETH